ncbi:ACT domain-containing protein [Arthrobacter sp. zg-Y411]|uniref:ACT domain-containing protein n=1 Tax=Arthrobacter zhangbolii TaxID=2886936 RepID=UPI001D158EE0|nr:ACT domain-containing protein [Arthrobacter zhangbolii]MCC3293934.1 ACT domain-containing protein [Arthrobacter zhangbolii]
MTLSTPAPTVELHALAGDYVIARLPVTAEVPAAFTAPGTGAGFISVTRTPQELSLVCPAALAPANAETDGPWTALYAAGPMPFGLTGVVTSLVAPLSAAGCPVFVVSTFDGDILLVPSTDYARACDLLLAAGHTLRRNLESGTSGAAG